MEDIQYIEGIPSVQWGLASVRSVDVVDNISTVGLTSVLWRVFSTVEIKI